MPSFYILICISTLLMQHKMVIVFCTTKCFLVAVIVSGTCQSLLEIASLQEAILLGRCLPKRKVLAIWLVSYFDLSLFFQLTKETGPTISQIEIGKTFALWTWKGMLLKYFASYWFLPTHSFLTRNQTRSYREQSDRTEKDSSPPHRPRAHSTNGTSNTTNSATKSTATINASNSSNWRRTDDEYRYEARFFLCCNFFNMITNSKWL